jgi:hypothetical protein
MFKSFFTVLFIAVILSFAMVYSQNYYCTAEIYCDEEWEFDAKAKCPKDEFNMPGEYFDCKAYFIPTYDQYGEPFFVSIYAECSFCDGDADECDWWSGWSGF